jgi:hypothetical protein
MAHTAACMSPPVAEGNVPGAVVLLLWYVPFVTSDDNVQLGLMSSTGL